MKMKRLLSVLMACALLAMVLCCPAGPVRAEEADTKETLEDSPLASFDCWQARNGNVVFALPGIPKACLHEEDWDTYWKDSSVVWGTCVQDGMEYQLRRADIGPWIEDLIATYPEDDPANLRYNALYGYASMQITSHDGSTGQPAVNPETEMMLFSYTYPDTPGVDYAAKAYLDGTQATVLYMGQCEHLEEAQKRFTKLTAEEAAARTEDNPYWLHFHGKPVTFPRTPCIYEKDGRADVFCLADDLTRIIASYVNVGLVLGGDDPAEVEPLLRQDAQDRIDSIVGGTILEGSVSGDESEWRYDFTFMQENSLNETYPDTFRWRGVTFIGENGIWTLACNDTETGRAFIGSLGEITDATVSPRYRLTNSTLEAPPRKRDGAPATLGQFVKDLTALLRANEDSEWFDEEFINIGDAVHSDGKWVRPVMFQALDLMALLYVSSDAEDAAVNEIRVLVGGDYEEEVADILGSLCIEAAEGKTDQVLKQLRKEGKRRAGGNFRWKGERYEAEKSLPSAGTPFYGMTVRALNPAEQKPVPEAPDGSNLFAVPAGSVKQFRDRWYRLNWNVFGGKYTLYHMDGDAMEAEDGTVSYVSSYGNKCAVGLSAESGDPQAGIVRAKVFGLNGDVEEVCAGGLLALACVTGMPDEQFWLTLMMLGEYPDWEDLAQLDPIVGWNGKQLVLSEEEFDGKMIPAAYILDEE